MRREYLKSIFVIATILGTVSISNSAFAADISDLGDLTNSRSYQSNSTTNINSSIILGTSASDGPELPTIENITDLVVKGNNNILSGYLAAKDETRDISLTRYLVPAHYEVKNSTVTFQNITFKDLYTDCYANPPSWGLDTSSALNYSIDGGLYRTDSTTNLTLNNVTFNDNDHHINIVKNMNRDLSASITGGIINNSGTTNIKNSNFSGNSVQASINRENDRTGNTNTSITGGLIYNNGEATITDTTFNNNTAYTTANQGTVSNLGGVIYNDEGKTLTIDGSVFTNNTTASNDGTVLGGAIYNKGTINISDTIFNNNRAGIATNIDSAKTSAALNDIYFDSNSSMNVVAGGTINNGIVQIGSGLASKDSSAKITIKDGANLVISRITDSSADTDSSTNTDPSAYTGSVEVQANGLLTFLGEPDVVNTFDKANVLFSGDLSGIEYSLDDDYTLTSDDFSNFTIGDNVNQLRFLKSGVGTLTIGSDLSKLKNVQAFVSEGTLVGADGNYFSSGSTYVTNLGVLEYTVTSGEFNQKVTLLDGILKLFGSSDENILLSDNINLDNGLNTVSLNNSNYTINSEYSSSSNVAQPQIFQINNSTLKFDDSITNFDHDVTLNGSTLNTQNEAINELSFNSLTATGDSKLSIDVNFAGGTSDIINTGSGSGSINLSDINFINTGDDGSILDKTFHVLIGGMNFNSYTGQYDSGVYIYDLSTNGKDVLLKAIENSAGGLKYQNHKDGDRIFSKIGDANYVISSDLETTAEGTFTVSNASSNNNIISGDDAYSFFEVGDNTTLNISNLVFTDAKASADGDSANTNGSIINQTGGIVNITDSTLKDSVATGNGGAIYTNGGKLIIGVTSENSTSTISGNTATNGGGLYIENGTATITDSTISGNNATNGGGLYIKNGTATITDSTISGNGNTTTENGGGLYVGSGATVSVTGSTFENNTADLGSAIYNDGGTVSLKDVDFEGNSGDYIYNNGGIVNLNYTDGNTLNNAQESRIYNNGTLNISNGQRLLSINDTITGNNKDNSTINLDSNGGGTIAIKSIENSTVNVNSAWIDIDSLQDSTINVYAQLGAQLKDVINSVANFEADNISHSIDGGSIAGSTLNVKNGTLTISDSSIDKTYINVDSNGFVDLESLSGTVSANLSGAGSISQDSSDIEIVGDNSKFTGTYSIYEGKLTLSENSFFGPGSKTSLNTSDLTWNLNSNDNNDNNKILNGTNYSNVILRNGSTFSIIGNNITQNVTIGNGLWTSDGSENSLNFSKASFVLGDGLPTDIFNFNNANVTLTLDNTTAYNMNLNNSKLDLSNEWAGDVYTINTLDSKDSSFSVDVSLILVDGKEPTTDKINVASGSGILNLDKIYITGDNGLAAETGQNFLIFNGTAKDVGLAVNEGVEILSWATNVYKYSIDSAKINNKTNADGIKVVPKGFSSSDTLRDLNIYDGNRGFNYVLGAKDGNVYHIYRDLDTTQEGSFTILGTKGDTTKSVLSGVLKDLVVEADSDRLKYDSANNKCTYQEADGEIVNIDSSKVSFDENSNYVISVGALGKNETRGSFFELVNDTDLEIQDVSIENAARYETKTDTETGTAPITDGSVIYANNTNATVTATNTDFKNNEVLGGNGGAIANELSSSFILKTSKLEGNSANNDGGAIYNASTGSLNIEEATFKNNSAGGNGGALFNSGSDVTISNSKFNGNTADWYGGAIYNSGSGLTLSNATFSNNTASYDGGAIYNTGSNITISNANFDGNTAAGNGGAIYTSGNMTITDSNFGATTTNKLNDGTLNDIYLAGSANVIFNVTKDEKSINSGIAGVNGTKFIKDGSGTLNLSGVNNNMFGEFEIKNGKVVYNQQKDTVASFVSGAVNLSTSSSVLEMNIDDTLSSSMQNLKGKGNVIKDGQGLLVLSGDNSGFEGNLNITNGKVLFDGTNYISGNTELSSNAILEYYTAENQNLSLDNVLDSGTINKTGSGVLNFDRDKDFAGKIISDDGGILNVNDTTGADTPLVMSANNGSTINYQTISNYTIDSSTISFVGSGNTVNIVNGTHTLNADISSSEDNNTLGFENATLNLGSTNYTTGKYLLDNTTIDLSGDNEYNTYNFNNLSTKGNVNLSVDVDLSNLDTISSPGKIIAASDKLISKSTGEIYLTNLKFANGAADSGLYNPIKINVVGGNLTLNTVEPTSFSTDVYEYDLTVDNEDNQSVILTAVKAASGASLGIQNRKDGTRIFTFTSSDDNPYFISNDLGNTGSGTFAVNGTGKDSTVIDGSAKYSMFEVANADSQLNVNDVTIQYANTSGNGSVLNQTANVVTNITNTNISGNSSAGKGGAIYVGAGTVYLTDVTFSDNTAGNEANDIYIENGAAVNVIANEKAQNTISSGVAGEGLLDKLGTGTLNLSGNNADFKGNLTVSQGSVNFEQKQKGDSYITGFTNLANSSSSVSINNACSDVTSGSFKGLGSIQKSGDKDLILTGDNSLFKGTATINGGNISYNTDNTKYFSGNTVINKDGGLKIEGSAGTKLSNISGNGTITKDNEGDLLFQGKNTFNGNLNVNRGTLALGANSSLGTINNATFADGTSINLQNTSAVQNSVGEWTTNPNPASIENLVLNNVVLQGNTKLYLDVDLANNRSDTITVNKFANGSTGNFILGENSLNIVSDALVNNMQLQIAKGAAADRVILEEAAKVAMGPIQKYDVNYADGLLMFAGQGGLKPTYDEVNPSILASPVAAQLGGYLVQLQSYDEAFRNMDMYMLMTKEQRYVLKMRNKYAITESSGVKYNSLYDDNSGWFRPYATFESVPLHNGPKVSNVAYGSFFGGDSKLYDLGHGWDGMFSFYAGYNGSHQAYNGVSMYQNGGTLGVVGMAYKGNFFTGLTANVGANVGEANTMFGHEDFAMLMTGVASKTGYNFELAHGKFIIQPSFLMSYSFVNTFDYTNAAGVGVSSDPLHAIQLEPGIKFIANLKNGWQPYLGVSMVWNIMDRTQFMANNVSLPSLSVDPYVKYGVGVRKTWGERLVGYFQTYLTNGGRNGVGLQCGFRWTLGKEPKAEPKTVNNNVNDKLKQQHSKRTVIKSLASNM